MLHSHYTVDNSSPDTIKCLATNQNLIFKSALSHFVVVAAFRRFVFDSHIRHSIVFPVRYCRLFFKIIVK